MAWNEHQKSCTKRGLESCLYQAPKKLHWFSDKLSRHIALWDGSNLILTNTFSHEYGYVYGHNFPNNINTNNQVQAQRIMIAMTFNTG